MYLRNKIYGKEKVQTTNLRGSESYSGKESVGWGFNSSRGLQAIVDSRSPSNVVGKEVKQPT